MMIRPVKIWLMVLLSVLYVAVSGGCGYNLGSIMPAQIKTIAVAPVVNDTLAYNAAAEMRGMLCERFMVDGSLKVKDLNTADCIVYCKILSVAFTEVTPDTYDDNKTYRAAEWQVRLQAEFTVIIPGRKDPLVPKREVTGLSIFQVQADMDTNRRYAIRQACYEAAREVVEYTTERW